MQPQRIVIVIILVLATLFSTLLLSPLPTTIAQMNPTDQELTVRAAIGELLTATQAAQSDALTKTAIAQQTASAEALALTRTQDVVTLRQTQTAVAVTPDLTKTIEAGLQATVTALAREAEAAIVSEALLDIASPLLEVPGGEFQMGTTILEAAESVQECTEVYSANCLLEWAEDSLPRHPVRVDRFFIERTEVTNSQYLAFLNDAGVASHQDCDGFFCVSTREDSPTSSIILEDDTYSVPGVIADSPITHVTWYGAKAYCEALGRRLPTEAEWEFAARGTDERLYPWGNLFSTSLARTYADREVGAVPAESYLAGASPYGAINMAGNVAEWVKDWYSASYYSIPVSSEPNPTGPLMGTDRVIRGGSWDAMPFLARSVHRQHLPPEQATTWVGFRCAADEASSGLLLTVPQPTITTTPVATPTATAR